jgi:hypothetical protein
MYRCNQAAEIPKEIQEKLLGQKRSREQAKLPENHALSMHYVRDYAFTETFGGTKGEKNDYLLVNESASKEGQIG